MPNSPFTYTLPQERIAQRPVHPYDSAKLLVVNRTSGELSSAVFNQLPKLLPSGSMIVVNKTRVAPVRLYGRILSPEREVEVFLTERVSEREWWALGRPLKHLQGGVELLFEGGFLGARVIEHCGDRVRVALSGSEESQYSIDDLITRAGRVPIPPYIREGKSDHEDCQDYQTVWGKGLAEALHESSLAASTAALHFTDRLVSELENCGVEFETLRLRVGLASIQPLERFAPSGAPPPEAYTVTKELLEKIKRGRHSGRRIISCGTTVIRALESCAAKPIDGAGWGLADIFIQPGFNFRLTDGIITNFHLPGSTHLLLVEALLGRELLERSYQYAMDNDFRFLSYGDAMLVL